MSNLTQLFLISTLTSSLLACSSSEQGGMFNLETARNRWDTPEKSWSLSELKSLEQGRVTYRINCAACHGREGDGNKSMGAPALAKNAVVRGEIKRHIEVINNGKAVMPAYKKILKQSEIFKIAAYERNAWGNHDFLVFDHQQESD